MRLTDEQVAAIKAARARFDDSPNEYVDALLADLEEARRKVQVLAAMYYLEISLSKGAEVLGVHFQDWSDELQEARFAILRELKLPPFDAATEQEKEP